MDIRQQGKTPWKSLIAWNKKEAGQKINKVRRYGGENSKNYVFFLVLSSRSNDFQCSSYYGGL